MRTENGFQKIGKERKRRQLYVSTWIIQRATKLGLWKPGHYSDLVNIALDEYLADMEEGLEPWATHHDRIKIKKGVWQAVSECNIPGSESSGTKTRQPPDSIPMEHPVPIEIDSTPPGDTPLQGPGPAPQPGPGPS